MRYFNYANYAKTIEIGISNPNMTKIATTLFEPIINRSDVLNQKGNPYHIDSKQAKSWYDKVKDIPGPLKRAAGNQDVIGCVIDYFSESVIDTLINPLKEAKPTLIFMEHDKRFVEDIANKIIRL